jgi:hypothetical protein
MTRCLIPSFDGAFLSHDSKDALWDKFYTAAPPRRRQSVEHATLIAVIETGQSSWLVAGIVPGIERQPLKKLGVDESALLKLPHRWREEAEKAGHKIKRIAVAFEAGRAGFWLARWLNAHDIETHVIHASSVAVSREHRRAKTDRLDRPAQTLFSRLAAR